MHWLEILRAADLSIGNILTSCSVCLSRECLMGYVTNKQIISVIDKDTSLETVYLFISKGSL